MHPSNKRKRDLRDQGQPTSRPAPGTNMSGNPGDMTDQDTANYLAAHNASNDDGMQQFDLHQNAGANGQSVGDTAAAALAYSHQLQVPQGNDLSFQTQAGGDNDAFSMTNHHQPQQTGMPTFTLEALKEATQTNRPTQPTTNESPPTSSHKPPVGSEEWHKVRRDNHKEVERRRRETINEGINELAKIVPGCEKNKGSILARAVQFITQLKENEAQNIEKWTLEKLLTEQAITELSASCDKFKAECQHAWDECNIYKRACEAAGIVPEEIKQRQANNAEQNGQN